MSLERHRNSQEGTEGTFWYALELCPSHSAYTGWTIEIPPMTHLYISLAVDILLAATVTLSVEKELSNYSLFSPVGIQLYFVHPPSG